MSKNAPTKVVTGKVRLSYAHLFEARAAFEGQEPRFSAVIMVPKTDTETMDKLRAAQQAALEKGKERFGGKIPNNWKNTIHDGDEEADLERNPEYAGHYYFNAASKTRPGMVDQALNPIMDQTELYSGVYARVSVNAFAYSVSGSKGVSFGLNNIQKLADGESFAGAARPEDDFDEIDADDLL